MVSAAALIALALATSVATQGLQHNPIRRPVRAHDAKSISDKVPIPASFLRRASRGITPRPASTGVGPRYFASPSPIYPIRTWVYARMKPFADAVVTVEKDEQGLLRAVVREGQKRRPAYMLWPVVRHWHTIALTVLVVAYVYLGFPRASGEAQCASAAWLARIMMMTLLVMVNGALY